MDLDQKTIQKILDKYSLGKFLSLKKETLGITGSVFNINNKFIIKIEGGGGRDKLRVERNAAMCDILEKNGIRCPKVIALDTSREIIEKKYVMMSKLEGDNLVDVWNEFSTEEQYSIALEFGRIMARIHQIKMENFGDIIHNDQQHDSWHDFITRRYKRYFSYLESNPILSTKTLDRVRSLFKENDDMFHIKSQSVLVHVDFQSKNIKYHQGRINGIFDFDECLGGHNEFEFTKVFLPYTVEQSRLLKVIKKLGVYPEIFFQE